MSQDLARRNTQFNIVSRMIESSSDMSSPWELTRDNKITYVPTYLGNREYLQAQSSRPIIIHQLVEILSCKAAADLQTALLESCHGATLNVRAQLEDVIRRPFACGHFRASQNLHMCISRVRLWSLPSYTMHLPRQGHQGGDRDDVIRGHDVRPFSALLVPWSRRCREDS